MILEILIEAIKKIPLEQVDHPDLGIQERVFCYELYHQLRKMEENNDIKFGPARIQGELNKEGQGLFGVHEPQPDLLFHKPGGNMHNHCVVEVKLARERDKGRFKTDLWKLARFSKKYVEYNERILLIVGKDNDIDRAMSFIDDLKTEDGISIMVVIYNINQGININEIKYDEEAGP